MRVLALLAGLLLSAPAPRPSPPTVDAPAIGVLLVANRQVSGYFAETVIVLLDHGENGTLGVIVNRPVELTIDELLPEFDEARGRRERAFAGGPVAPDRLLLLIRTKEAPKESATVLPGVYVSGHPDTLRELLRGPGKGVEFRAYVGYAGWAPGQLVSEIARGDWTLAPGDEASVFTKEPDGLWEKLLHRHQQIQVRTPDPAPERGRRSRGRDVCAPVGPAPKHLDVLTNVPDFINLSAPWRSAAASSAFRTSGRAPSSTH